MEDRSEIAVELHHKGYNCAQAVVCAYADLLGLDSKTAFSMSEGFGAGMGGLQSTCGAVSGMLMLAGMKNSNGEIKEQTSKAHTYKIAKDLTAKFEEKNTTIICKELKGLTGGEVLRSCDGCIVDACQILAEYFLDEQ